VSCRLPNRGRKPVFKPKERNSCALYKFVITIVISRLVSLVAANVLIAAKVTVVLGGETSVAS
jgi:hypothetical protein